MTRIACRLLLLLTFSLCAQEPKKDAAPKPQWQRMLKGEDAKKAGAIYAKLAEAKRAGDIPEAIKWAGEMLAHLTRIEGDDHWQVRDAKLALDELKRTPLSEAQQERLAEAARLNADVVEKVGKGKFDAAIPVAEKVLKIHREIRGPKHLDNATSLNNLAYCYQAKGRYSEAEPLIREALNLHRESSGDRHPNTAESLNNLAFVFESQAKYADAEPMFLEALAIRRDALGDRDPETAVSLNNLAFLFQSRGKYADADPLYRDALKIRRERLGEDHPDVAVVLDNLAVVCKLRGRFAEAETLSRDALRIFRASKGDHPSTAMSTSNRARIFESQGKDAEAETLNREALRIFRKVLGDRHPSTATSATNLAVVLQSQGKFAEAEPLLVEALETRRKMLGDDHPDTAKSLALFAAYHDAREDYAKALPLYREVLTIRRKRLGDSHPETASVVSHLATALLRRGDDAEAEAGFREALQIVRESLGESHPDTVASRNNLAGVAQMKGQFAGARTLLLEATRGFEASRAMRAKALERSVANGGNNPYPPLAVAEANLGKPAEGYRALELDFARGLLDESASRLGVGLSPQELKKKGELVDGLEAIDPRIRKLATSLQRTEAERKELETLSAERRKLDDELADLAAALSQRQVAELAAIQKAIPADAALVAWVDVAESTGRLQEHWACVVRAVGEPKWQRLPGSGLESKWTPDDTSLPGRFRAALAANPPSADVAGLAAKLQSQRIAPILKHLDGVKTLYVVPVNVMAGIPVEVLAPQFAISYVPSGTYLARAKARAKPAGSAVLALGDPVFGTSGGNGGGGWSELPGTRLELAAIRRSFGDKTTTFADTAASEQSLEALRKSGELAKFRYLHFATHGEGNSVRAFESALILARDRLPKELLSKPGEPFVDGRLSASEVLEYWKLDAELVTLSACETAIGKQAGGDGLLGFAQAFLSVGSRSVCLSLWKVDDTATALLMDRFYRNLSGKREGLQKAMGKSAALSEAKKWLRELSSEEASRLAASLSEGAVRGKGQKALQVVSPVVDPKADPKAGGPFWHPRFWAAFVLIGDPD